MCQYAAYPHIAPAMMKLVRRGDVIPLARHAASSTGCFAALAGFLEAGESIEDATHREVLEEVGLKETSLNDFGNQSWRVRHSLTIALTAEYAGGELMGDTNEISEACWFGRGDALPEIPRRSTPALREAGEFGARLRKHPCRRRWGCTGCPAIGLEGTLRRALASARPSHRLTGSAACSWPSRVLTVCPTIRTAPTTRVPSASAARGRTT